jgi:hypothetical protein
MRQLRLTLVVMGRLVRWRHPCRRLLLPGPREPGATRQ